MNLRCCWCFLNNKNNNLLFSTLQASTSPSRKRARLASGGSGGGGVGIGGTVDPTRATPSPPTSVGGAPSAQPSPLGAGGHPTGVVLLHSPRNGDRENHPAVHHLHHLSHHHAASGGGGASDGHHHHHHRTDRDRRRHPSSRSSARCVPRSVFFFYLLDPEKFNFRTSNAEGATFFLRGLVFVVPSSCSCNSGLSSLS